MESAAKKLGFPFSPRKYFSPVNLFSPCKSQARSDLEYCSHIWGKRMNEPHLISSLPILAHCRLVGDLYIFYRYFQDLCPDELTATTPPLNGGIRKPGQLQICIGLQIITKGQELIFPSDLLYKEPLRFRLNSPPQSVFRHHTMSSSR